MQNLGLMESIGEYLGDGSNAQLETVGDWRFFFYSENESEPIRVYPDSGASYEMPQAGTLYIEFSDDECFSIQLSGRVATTHVSDKFARFLDFIGIDGLPSRFAWIDIA
jgi:hypothetical protein